MTKCHGYFYHGNQSGQHAAIMQVDKHGNCQFLLAGDSLIKAGNFNQLNTSPRLGNTPRLIYLQDGSSFETADNESIDHVITNLKSGRGYRLLHRIEMNFSLVLLFTVLVVVFVWGAAKFGIPALANNVAHKVPAGMSQYMGHSTLELLDKKILAPSQLTQQRQAELQLLFQRYTSQFPDLNIQIVFREGNHIGANAMALPDGHIVFTDQLIELAIDDREILAILGHEIGHIQHRHLLRRALQNSMVTGIFLWFTSDLSSISSLVYALPTLLMEMAYSRQFETEADDMAYQLLIDNDIDPEHFARIMVRLTDAFIEIEEDNNEKDKDKEDESSKVLSYFTSHPATEERIQRFLHKH